jgi:hypothetical protein
MIGANVSAFSIGKAVGRGGGGNLAPVITSSPVTTASVGIAYSYQVQATDPEGGSLSYSLPTKPTGMTISASGLVQWTPSSSGSDAVVVRVTDDRAAFTDQAYSIASLVTELWSTSSNNIIALQAGNSIRFAVPSNNPSPNGSWQYRLGSSAWSTFSTTVIDLGSAKIRISDGSTFRYILRSSNWASGNNSYIQRFFPGTDVAPNVSDSGGENAAKSNNAGNFNTYFF